MKKLWIYGCLLLLAAACKNQSAPAAGTESSDASKPVDIPYTLEKPWMNWKTGDPNNAAIVMKMLKAWETGKLDECRSYFADSTVMIFDYYRAKLSQDSLKTFLERTQDNYATLKVRVDDYESVISDDKKEEWVSVWYKQSWTDKKGKADSISINDEARLKDGKIATFVEYGIHYPMPKK